MALEKPVEELGAVSAAIGQIAVGEGAKRNVTVHSRRMGMLLLNLNDSNR